MKSDWIKRRCEWATSRVNSILGGNSLWFEFNKLEHRFEFWEQRGPVTQMIFPLTLGNSPLPDITDWEIRHAVQFVQRARQKYAEDRYYQQKEYEKWENHKRT